MTREAKGLKPDPPRVRIQLKHWEESYVFRITGDIATDEESGFTYHVGTLKNDGVILWEPCP